MDSTTARTLLNEVREDIANLEGALADHRRLEAYLLAKAGASASEQVNGQPTAITPTENPFAKMTQAEVAAAILKESGLAMNTQQIVEVMLRRGFPWDGDRKQLVNSIFSAMRRSQRFKKIAKGLWTLNESASENERRDR